MSEQNIFGREIDGTITSDDVLGKDVIDKAGVFVGVVEKVFIDPKELNFVGISLDKGFLRKGLLIGTGYIEKIMNHAIFLNIRVAYELKGMEVFDRDGVKIGHVTNIMLVKNQNSIKEIEIKSGFFQDKFTIPFEMVENVGYNIILSVTKKELLNLKS